jgi:hypothetical protein
VELLLEDSCVGGVGDAAAIVLPHDGPAPVRVGATGGTLTSSNAARS